MGTRKAEAAAGCFLLLHHSNAAPRRRSVHRGFPRGLHLFCFIPPPPPPKPFSCSQGRGGEPGRQS